MANTIFGSMLARVMVVFSLLALLYAPMAHAARKKTGGPPNVVMLITDQHNYRILGCAGNDMVKTPHLDRLAKEGARFTRAICATPFCSPTRASFITGQWPHTHGIVYNVNIKVNKTHANKRRAALPELPGIVDEHITLDNLLFDNGYRLRHLGKWHLGYKTDLRCYRNQDNEFGEKGDYRKWLKQQEGPLYDRNPRPGEVLPEPRGRVFLTESMAEAHEIWKDEPKRSPQDLSIIGRSALAPRAQYETFLTDRAVAWLEKNADKPFMLTLSVSPPHALWVAPDPYYSMYDPAEMFLPPSFRNRPGAYGRDQAMRMGFLLEEDNLREYLRCYYAQVTMMDELFGRVMDKLRQLGVEDNTLVIFTSDHGDMQAAHGSMGKGIRAYYEEIVRVPLIVRYPGKIPAGRVLDMHADSVDIMPTVLDYVGRPVPSSVQGRSLRPFLEGTKEPDDRPGFCERHAAGKHASRMIRTADWKYNLFGDGRRELFNLAKDPYEIDDLAGKSEYKDQKDRLEQQLLEHMKRTNDPAVETFFKAE